MRIAGCAAVSPAPKRAPELRLRIVSPARRRNSERRGAPSAAAMRSRLIGEEGAGSLCCLEQDLGINLMATKRNPGRRPLAHQANRAWGRQRPDPEVLVPASAAATATHPPQNRGGRLAASVAGAADVRRLAPIGERDAESEHLLIGRAPPRTVVNAAKRGIELIATHSHDDAKLQLQPSRIDRASPDIDGGPLVACEHQLDRSDSRQRPNGRARPRRRRGRRPWILY